MKFGDYITEAKQRKLTQPVIKKINKEIHKYVKDTYYQAIPLQDIFDAMKKFGIVALQEDQTEWDGMLLGGVKKTEQVYFDLGWLDSWGGEGAGGGVRPGSVPQYEVVPNARLNLSYYKMPSGKYEVLAYVS
jgi:hypothetical protein